MLEKAPKGRPSKSKYKHRQMGTNCNRQAQQMNLCYLFGFDIKNTVNSYRNPIDQEPTFP